MNEVQVHDGGLPFAREDDAIISPCNTYRYLLTRRIPQIIRHVKPALFVMLNPSTATASVPDPTMTRCVGFARDWGCTSLSIVNVFALRSKDPELLYTHHDPRGPDNSHHVDQQLELHAKTGIIVCAWGAEKIVRQQPWIDEFVEKMKECGAKCLGMNKDGSPKHPLYLPKKAELIPWKGFAA